MTERPSAREWTAGLRWLRVMESHRERTRMNVLHIRGPLEGL